MLKKSPSLIFVGEASTRFGGKLRFGGVECADKHDLIIKFLSKAEYLVAQDVQLFCVKQTVSLFRWLKQTNSLFYVV